eukprot:TRINITY_DN23282_c0_g2_i1.p1 TRINITY_DN23282_c0_g2~~TRINITY_DN23282_c0_g2_i1.p1  ORF type:complete len:302 (-),score=94.70 TRINITY_DN23282_c0_g2_i1:259-1164(-)
MLSSTAHKLCVLSRVGRVAASSRTFAQIGRQVGRVGPMIARPTSDAAAVTASLGKFALGGLALLGMGGLLTYGASSTMGARNYDLWEHERMKRVRTTFGYFGASLGITAVGSFAASRFISRVSPTAFLVGSVLATFGTLIPCLATRKENTGLKHALWAAFSFAEGCALTPAVLMFAPFVAPAAIITGATCLGTSMLAAVSPDDKFLAMGGPLSIGLMLLLGSSLASVFIKRPMPVMNNLISYGGAALFGGFMLYDAKRMMVTAQHPSFDPINSSLKLYLDFINFFTLMLRILGQSSGGRRR